MKTYIKTSSISTIPCKFDIVIDIEYFDSKSSSGTIVASDYKGFPVPDGPIISGVPDALLNSQAIADFDAFLESITDLIVDYYQLEIYYKNNSPYHSCYLGMLAKDSKGNIIFDFDFTLRISNHEAHRTEQSQKYKKERKHALSQLTGGKKLKPITRSIIVNGELYNTYLEAFQYIDEVIEKTIEIMKRRENK